MSRDGRGGDRTALPAEPNSQQAPLPVLTGGSAQKGWQGRASVILAYLSFPLALLPVAVHLTSYLLLGSAFIPYYLLHTLGAGFFMSGSTAALLLGLWGKDQPGAREGRIASSFYLLAGAVIAPWLELM